MQRALIGLGVLLVLAVAGAASALSWLLYTEPGLQWVLSHTREGIPSTFLFRTGGDQTVRGYAFESLGVEKDGAIVGGRRLLVASAEYVHWFGENWGLAVFADTGNAWDSGVRPSLASGYGFGARIRTPIGPIRSDLASGQVSGDVRLHFSVGYSF